MNRRSIMLAVIAAMLAQFKKGKAQVSDGPPIFTGPRDIIGLELDIQNRNPSSECKAYGLVVRYNDRIVKIPVEEMMDILEGKSWFERLLERITGK
jgi:hypothetical protein